MINIIEETRDYIIVAIPVLVPNLPDCEYSHGEKPLTTEQIRKFATEFLEWRLIDLEHEFLYSGKVIGTLMESHITKEPTVVRFIDGTPREYPAGTWFVLIKITDRDVIQGIHNNEYTGGSATTIEREDAEKLRKLLDMKVPASTKSSIKRILISDIKDPVVVTISIVKSPCVPLAKFCSLKNRKVSDMAKTDVNEQLEEETKSFITRIGEIFGSTKANPKKEENDDESNDDGSKKQPDYVTRDDFNELKSEILELVSAMNDKVNANIKEDPKEEDDEDEEVEGLTPEEEETLQKLLAKKEASTKAETKPEDEDEKTDEEEEEEDEIKASSKSTPVHDNGNKPQLQSDAQIVYGIMGRDTSGSPKRE